VVSRITTGTGQFYLTNAPFIGGRPVAFRLPLNSADPYLVVPWEVPTGDKNFPWFTEVEPDEPV